MSDDRPASVADIVVEELRQKEINRPIRLPKRDFFTRGQKLKVKDPWHILSGYDLEFAGGQSSNQASGMRRRRDRWGSPKRAVESRADAPSNRTQ
jgi:hypothetical protein